MNLYEIEIEYRETVNALIENGGALTPEIEASMAISLEMFEAKATAYALIIKELQSEDEQLENVIFELQRKRKSRQESINRLKERLLSAMQAFDRPKYKTLLFSMWIQESKSLKIIKEHAIPKEFQKKVTEIKILGAELKKAIQEGLETDCAVIETRDNLQIR
jgi:Mg2+ and Co2+ transporter CorA